MEVLTAMASLPFAFRELHTPEEMALVVQMEWEIWGPSDATPANQLVISVKTGGHVIAAFAEGALAGFVYGFPAIVPGQEPWIASHMLAVRPSHAGSGLGRELKWRQRDLALAQGYRRMTWTFDPLEARNAHLNLNLLGAVAREYIVNCYGSMDDRLNAGLPSDRLMADWDLQGERAARARAGGLLAEGSLRVPIPRDFQAVKRRNLEEALALRLEVRAALQAHLAAGRAVLGYDRVRGDLLLG